MILPAVLTLCSLVAHSYQAVVPDVGIINGNEATPHAYPYTVKVYIYFTNYVDRKVQQCGGSLISESYVLTAAHCLYLDGYIIEHAYLIFGAHDVSVLEPGSVHLNSTYLVPHQNFNSQSLDNDIAVIRLPALVKESSTIRIIRLPKKSEANVNYIGQIGTETGWGKTSDNNPVLPNKLRVVQLPVTYNSVCAQVLPTNIDSTKLCTAGAAPNKGGCKGDSGGPLVINGVQVGIVSHGLPTCETLYGPEVFTRVASYLDWLEVNTDARIEN